MKHFVGTCLAAILTVSATASHAATTVSGTVSGNFSVNIAPIDSTRNTRLVLDIDAAQLLSSFLSERAYVSFKVADAFDEKGRPISFYEEDLGTEFLIAQPLTVGQTHFEFLINGQYVDPLSISKASDTVTVDAASRAKFVALSNSARMQLDLAETLVGARLQSE